MIRMTPIGKWYEINISSDPIIPQGSDIRFGEDLPEESIIWKLAAMAFAL